jgi:aryl-alcohol dehydrogenase-like predicted oxidoreductase
MLAPDCRILSARWLMQKRACPASGLKLPLLGVGCFSFGGGSYWGEQSQRDVDEVVAAALDLGVNFFDTAETYNNGASETSLGEALRGRRDAAIVCTKIQPDHCYRDEIRRHCEASLARLKTDRIDIYMIHWPLNPSSLRHYTSDAQRLAKPPSIREALHELDALRREGKVRHLGVSNFAVAQLDEAVATGVPLVLNELPYNLLSRGIEAAVLPACERHGLGVLAYTPLAQGLLSGKFANFDELPPMRTRTRHFRGDRPGSRHGGPGFEAETLAALENLRRVADRAKLPLGDLALAWAIANPAITCTLVGARNRAQLEANVRAASIAVAPALRAELSRATDALLKSLGDGIDYHQSLSDSRSW